MRTVAVAHFTGPVTTVCCAHSLFTLVFVEKGKGDIDQLVAAAGMFAENAGTWFIVCGSVFVLFWCLLCSSSSSSSTNDTPDPAIERESRPVE